MEFLDWLSDIWNSVIETSWEIVKVGTAVVVGILTIPLWLLPFVVWLVFVKLKGGDSHG